MNKISFDRLQMTKDFPSALTLGEIFFDIEKKLILEGQIVCRFLVNGMLLSELDEKKFSQFELSHVDFLEVESEKPDILLSKVIENWIESLPLMIAKSDSLSRELKLKGMENQFAQFVDLVDSCQFLVESLVSLRTLCHDSSSVTSSQWKKNEDLTARAISESLTVFEKKDFVLLSDILEYDLAHCLQSWLEALMELRINVQQKAPDLMGK